MSSIIHQYFITTITQTAISTGWQEVLLSAVFMVSKSTPSWKEPTHTQPTHSNTHYPLHHTIYGIRKLCTLYIDEEVAKIEQSVSESDINFTTEVSQYWSPETVYEDRVNQHYSGVESTV